ncbi:methionine--tRNA ligase, partial [Vibrio anguillarum]|nr:methionine--tRNA ligase [Vibrio anguillarum]
KTFRTLWPQLGVEPDVFIRTTAEDHKAHIQDLWITLERQRDIYLGHYSGNYCVACEQYYPERELVDKNICPVHKQPVIHVEEETYLFRIEKYRLALLEYYQTNPNAIVPQHFQKTIIEQLKSEQLDDLSISRFKNKWGIQVPSNHEHTVYVWIDALFSYITAIQRISAEKTEIAKTQHIIGKDILLFHAVYWPAFLLSLNLPLPEKLVVHGWWTIDGEKISKSNPATTVNPNVFAEQLTTDGLRYALVRQKPLYRDGNVALDEFAEL